MLPDATKIDAAHSHPAALILALMDTDALHSRGRHVTKATSERDGQMSSSYSIAWIPSPACVCNRCGVVAHATLHSCSKSPSCSRYQNLPESNSARYFRIFKVSSIAASIPLKST